MTIDGPDAPWNAVDPPEKEVNVTICISLQKTFTLTVNDYDDEDLNKEEIKKAVNDCIVLPQNLALFTERMFKEDLDLKAAKMPRYLKEAIDDCKDWDVYDYEIIPD